MQIIDYLAMKLLLLRAALTTGGVEKVNTSLANDQLDSSACRSQGSQFTEDQTGIQTVLLYLST